MSEKRKLKILTISDTHGKNDQIRNAIEFGASGDIFIHAGDFT